MSHLRRAGRTALVALAMAAAIFAPQAAYATPPEGDDWDIVQPVVAEGGIGR